MRVLHVLASLNVGGAESRIMDVYRKIDRDKIEFSFLCMQEEKQFFEKEILQRGGEIIKIPHPRKHGAVRNFFKILKILKEGKYDAVHAHTSFHCGIVSLAAWLAKVPIRICHARTTSSKNSRWKTRFSLSIGRLLISVFSTDRLAISMEAGKYLFGREAFVVVPNAIDCDKYYDIQERNLELIKKEFDIDDEQVVIGLVGRFEMMKNHIFALEWFKEYSSNGNKKLVFVGDGQLREEIRLKVEELDISDKVIFTGIRKDVNLWMHVFDVLIVPSLFEGFGGVILEAQAAGTPVVKSDSFTNAADVDLGLVKQAKLNDIEDWTDKVNVQLNISKPTITDIQIAFDNKCFSLSKEIDILEGIYKGEKESKCDKRKP